MVVLYGMGKDSIRGIFNPENFFMSYNFSENEIQAIEMLTDYGRDCIKQYYENYP